MFFVLWLFSVVWVVFCSDRFITIISEELYDYLICENKELLNNMLV